MAPFALVGLQSAPICRQVAESKGLSAQLPYAWTMDFLRLLLVFLHILGTAAIVGGWLATFKHPTVTQWQWIGALTQLVTGLLLVGLAEMGDGDGPNHAKIAVKLVLTIGVVVAAFIGRRKAKSGHDVAKGLAHGVGGLALINVAVAVFWS